MMNTGKGEHIGNLRYGIFFGTDKLFRVAHFKIKIIIYNTFSVIFLKYLAKIGFRNIEFTADFT